MRETERTEIMKIMEGTEEWPLQGEALQDDRAVMSSKLIVKVAARFILVNQR